MAVTAFAPITATIKSGSTTHKVSFPAVDETDLKTLETGVSGWTVVSNRAGTVTTWSTPTVAEAASMTGVYELTLDEDTTITAGAVTEQMYITLTASGVADVHMSVEILGEVAADMTKISGDSTAADNLEAMLDGTGGVTLSLGQLAITTSGNDHGIAIDASSGTGNGINVQGGTSGVTLIGGTAFGMAISASTNDALAITTTSGSHWPIDLTGSSATRNAIDGHLTGDVQGDVTGLSDVTLANNGNHGGSSFVLTANRFYIKPTGANPALHLDGTVSTDTTGIFYVQGSSSAPAVEFDGGTNKSGLVLKGGSSVNNAFPFSMSANTDDISINLANNAGTNGLGIIDGKPSDEWVEEFFLVDSGTTYASAVAGSVVKEIADNATAGGAPTAAAVADAVWDEARSGHTTAGTYGEFVLTPHVLQETTIATLASQTSFTLTAGSTDDDAYRDAVIIVQDVSTQEQKGFARIQDYTGSTKTVTLQADLTPFTIATTDKVFIVQTPQVWDAELTGSLHNLARSSGRRLRRAQALLGADDDGLIDEGTAQAGTSTTIQIRAAYAGDIDDGTVVAIEGGTGAGQVREVGSYDTGTNTITIAGDNWATTPDSTSEYFVAHPQFCDMVVTGSNPTAAEIRTEIDSNSTQLAAIVADTNALDTDWADGGRLDLILDELTTQGDTNETKIDTIDTNVDTLITNVPDIVSLANINAEVDTALSDIKLDHLVAVADADDPVDDSIIAKLAASDGDWSGFDKTTDSLEAIRDRGDAAWTDAASGSDPYLMQTTTIATLASQTSFTLTAGSTDDDAYNGCLAVVTDQSTSTQKAVGIVKDYTGSTKTVTLRDDPGIFTMATGDTIEILANLSPWATPNILVQPSAIPVDAGEMFNMLYRVEFAKADITGSLRQFYDDAGSTVLFDQTRTQASGTETRGAIELP